MSGAFNFTRELTNNPQAPQNTGYGVATFLLGAVIGAAVLTNIVTAGLAGVLVPVTLDRMGQDPAVASSVFVTMITDSMGFFAFLGLAVASGLVG